MHQLRKSCLRFGLTALPRTMAHCFFMMPHRWNVVSLLKVRYKSSISSFSTLAAKFSHITVIQFLRPEPKSLTEGSPYCGFWDSELSAGCSGWLVRTSNKHVSDLIHMLFTWWPARSLILIDAAFIQKVVIPACDWLLSGRSPTNVQNQHQTLVTDFNPWNQRWHGTSCCQDTNLEWGQWQCCSGQEANCHMLQGNLKCFFMCTKLFHCYNCPD